MVAILLPADMDELRTPVHRRHNPRFSNLEYRRVHLPLPSIYSILLLATHQISVSNEK